MNLASDAETAPLVALADELDGPLVLVLGVGLGVAFFLVVHLLRAKGDPHPWLTDKDLPSTPGQWRSNAALLVGGAVIALGAFAVSGEWMPPFARILISLLALLTLALAGLGVSLLVTSYSHCFPSSGGHDAPDIERIP